MVRVGTVRIGTVVIAMALALPGCMFDPAPGSAADDRHEVATDVADVHDATDIPDVPPDAADVPVDIEDLPIPDGILPDVPPDGGELPLDVEGEDVRPDCGQVVCIDCVCDCGGGRMLPYGGCFDDCTPPPPIVENCSADCTAMCGTEPPKECEYEGSAGECPDGQSCVTVPCPHCGMQPPSFCVNTPCEPNGCYKDEHCSDGRRCYGGDAWTGVMGFCEAVPEDAVRCWADSACPSVARCDGPSSCPPCAVCDTSGLPGTCRLKDGQPEAVLLDLPYGMFSPGETIPPTWYDFTATDIFLAGCETFTIERKDASTGQWIDQGPPYLCGWEGIAVHVPAGGAERVMPFTAPVDGVSGGMGSYRLRGQYWTGCLLDQPISAAKCTGGPVDVLSAEYTVGVAP